jgi:hypothetical protein
MAGAASYMSFAAQINYAASVNATWQGSNDNVNWVNIPVHDTSSTTVAQIITAAFTATTSSTRYFVGKCQYRYLRFLANSTGSGSMSAFTRLNIEDITDTVATVINPTAANFLTTVTGSVSINGTPAVTVSSIIAGPAIASGLYTRITDGVSMAAVKAASTAPLATDCAQVVSISPNGNAVAISGNVAVIPGNTAAVAFSAAAPNGNGGTGLLSGNCLYGFSVTNTTAATLYLIFYATLTPTIGSTTPALFFAIPAGQSLTVMSDKALMYSATGISYASVAAWNSTAASTGLPGSIFSK